jgi:ERCC4-type nuclease
MLIQIDNRETQLILHIKKLIEFNCNFKDLQFQINNLPIGDIILSKNENEFVIFERKTIGDLVSSIRDGRYEEQSHRLSGSNFHNHNIIYLIEGDIQKFQIFNKSSLDKNTIYSALFSLNYYKGFSVLRTMNIEETAFYICNTANKINKNLLDNKTGFYNNCSSNLAEPEDIPYVNVVKKVKKDNITPENIGEIMLCQIPGISATTANVIMNKYKSINNLLDILKTIPSDLENITYLNNKSQTRKLNKTCVNNIKKYLVQEENVQSTSV